MDLLRSRLKWRGYPLFTTLSHYTALIRLPIVTVKLSENNANKPMETRCKKKLYEVFEKYN